jgi:hypothetical protein
MQTFLIVSLLILVTGCVTPYNKANFMSNDINVMQIDTITVMPILDFRINKEKELNLDKLLHNILEIQLKHRNYKCVMLTDRTIIAHIDQEELESHNKEWIDSINSAGGRWILFVALLDSSSQLTFGSTGSAEMSAYIFDKHNSKLIWQEKAIGSTGQGGLIGMTLKGLMETDAICTATQNLMKAIPVRNKDNN